MKSELKFIYRVVGYLGSVFLGSISVLMLYTIRLEWNKATSIGDSIWLYSSLFLFLFILTGSVFAIIYFSTGTISITDDELIKKTIRGQISIPFSKIDSVKIADHTIIFTGIGTKISIGKIYKDFETLNVNIARKIRSSGNTSGNSIQFYLNEFLEGYKLITHNIDNYSCSVKIERKSGWFDLLRSYEIILDGFEAGILKRGGSKELRVIPGEHEILIRTDHYSSKKISFSAKSNHITFECGNNVKGLSVLYSFLYLTIWRDDFLWIREIDQSNIEY